jgi:type II secretion system protein G
MNKRNYGFTLIELLIVVAIIAILAAIAIPNFLNAQTRSKIARAKGEMRTLTTALESYYVDNSCYARAYRPPYIALCSLRISMLSTPIAYISRIPKDPFGAAQYTTAEYDTYDYFDEASFIELRWGSGHNVDLAKPQWGGATWGRAWRLSSLGADRIQSYAGNIFAYANYPAFGWPAYYDPTNGTISNGDIIRFGPNGRLNYEDKIVGSIFDN